MRKLVVLMALMLMAGLALAQTTDDHTVTVQIPSILSLQLDATDYLFDFTDTSLSGMETVTVGGNSYTKASKAAYDTFIDTATGTQDFAPHRSERCRWNGLRHHDHSHQPGPVDGYALGLGYALWPPQQQPGEGLCREGKWEGRFLDSRPHAHYQRVHPH